MVTVWNKNSKMNSLYIKHPSMDLGRRAKIFSPFDALKGFSDELIKSEKGTKKNSLTMAMKI